MTYERPRPFGMRECPPQRTWLSLTLSTFAALSLFGLSAQWCTTWYPESREQQVTVRRRPASSDTVPRETVVKERVRKSVALVPHSNP